ncbi:MAG: methionine--tRNA ligase [Candidatus Eiseniibacteriota bacterium]
MTRFYVTDAIDYANGAPHLGHAYEKVVTDCLARAHRQAGLPTYFLAGMDEHGQKVERAARKEGVTPQEFVDRIHALFAEAWRVLRVEPDRFVRTSEPQHAVASQELFRRAHANGDVYEHEYEGLYCQGCEAFYQEKDLVDGKCPIHGTVPELVREKNFFFRLSRYAEPLLAHLATHPDFIEPEMRFNEVANVIRGGLEDISISRGSVSWGVPMPDSIPGGKGQTIYVWFDALINYLSALGYPDERYREWWCDPPGSDRPNALHIVGKDISRFHCIIWPAMLLSAGIPLPRRVYVHGFIYAKGLKLSKSLGNQIDPVAAAGRFGPDALRWYLCREISFGADGDFTWERFIERYNTDLANDYGNLLSRSASMLHKYRAGVVPARWEPTSVEEEIRALAETSARDVRAAYASLQPSAALEAAWALVNRANRYVEEMKPWQLAREENGLAGARLDTVLVTLLEVGRLATRWAWPAIPAKCEEAWAGLGLTGAPGDPHAGAATAHWFAGGDRSPVAGTKLPPVTILFPRIDAEKLAGVSES